MKQQRMSGVTVLSKRGAAKDTAKVTTKVMI